MSVFTIELNENIVALLKEVAKYQFANDNFGFPSLDECTKASNNNKANMKVVTEHFKAQMLPSLDRSDDFAFMCFDQNVGGEIYDAYMPYYRLMNTFGYDYLEQLDDDLPF